MERHPDPSMEPALQDSAPSPTFASATRSRRRAVPPTAALLLRSAGATARVATGAWPLGVGGGGGRGGYQYSTNRPCPPPNQPRGQIPGSKSSPSPSWNAQRLAARQPNSSRTSLL